MGQAREVFVTRLIVEQSIEERILELQDRKRKVARAAMTECEGQNDVDGHRIDDLKLLFDFK